MKEEILNSIKMEYQRQKELKIDIEKKIKKLEYLQENEFVKEYLDLLNFLDKVNYQNIVKRTEDIMLDSSFSLNMRYIEETNEIYVCIGTFKLSNLCDIEHGPSDEMVKRDDLSAEYRIYQDIEKDCSVRIPIKNCEDFENNHKIIFPDIYNAWRFYYNIQREFIKEAITTNQENACIKVLKKSSNSKI